MKVYIQTTTIRETSGDGSVYRGQRTYHRAYDFDNGFLFHFDEDLRKVKAELKKEGYTEFDIKRQTRTHNRSRRLRN